MKTNAPEKIYRTTTYLNSDRGNTKWKKVPIAGAENIEYTRTDAFIEKAWNWIEDILLSSNQQDKSLLYYERFKKYLEK